MAHAPQQHDLIEKELELQRVTKLDRAGIMARPVDKCIMYSEIYIF